MNNIHKFMKKSFFSFFSIFILILSLTFFWGCDSGSSMISKNQTDSCEKIAQNLLANDLDTAVSLSASLKIPLSEEETAIVMEALEKHINGRIKSILTSFASQSCLISQETIDEIKQYKEILKNVGIDDSNYTNIDDYVDSVLELDAYKKYDDIWVYWKVAIDDWNDGQTYWEYAVGSYSDYMRDSHLQKALNSFRNCVTLANTFNQNSFGIKEVKNIAQAYIDKIEYFFDTGYDLTVDDYIIDSFSSTQDEFSRESTKWLNKLKDLPTSVYYGK